MSHEFIYIYVWTSPTLNLVNASILLCVFFIFLKFDENEREHIKCFPPHLT